MDTLEGHFDVLANSCCFCVNTFADTPLFERIRPKYYVLLDHGWWEDNLASKYILAREATFGNIAKARWPLTLFIPFKARESDFLRRALDRLGQTRVSFYNDTRLAVSNAVTSALFRHRLAIPAGGNVLIAALSLALQLQFDRIFLLGADHTWLHELEVEDENVVCMRQRHFNSDDGAKSLPFEKFHDASATFTMPELLEAYSELFRGYHDLSWHAQAQRTKVVNLTPGSLIDAFPRAGMRDEPNSTR